MIRAGRLRHRVTVQRLSAGSPQQHPTGEPDESWSTYCSDQAASIDPVIGREFFAAGQQQSDVDVKIRMRYLPSVNDGINARMRIVHPTTCPCSPPAQQVYNIKGPINVEQRNREWLLYCATGLNEG